MAAPLRPLVYSLDDLVAMLSLSKSTIYAMVETDQFPKPRQMTARISRWDAQEVEDWLKSRPHKESRR